MRNFTTINPSSQIESILPQYIVDQYGQFVNFITTASESEERIGFGQDLLQNLQKYRDFDTYQNGIVRYGILVQNIDQDSEELVLEDGFGFPDENGVLYIDNEIILYRTKEENTFYGLQRGSAGTTVLSTFNKSGTYLETCPEKHYAGARVNNLSVLFLASMLEIIYDSFGVDIDASKIHAEVNQSTLLSNIRDFFQAKGTKLGIKSLFKMLFGDTGTDVSYPGDQIINPSVSTFAEDLICRVIPIPSTFYNSNEIEKDPGVLIGSIIQCKSYNDDKIYGESLVEYTRAYPYDQTIQYDLLLNDESTTGEFIVNPLSFLVTDLELNETEIEVDSTSGFPESGVLFIENEGILYTSKTNNYFLGCTRGYIGQEVVHDLGTIVRGPYYVQGNYIFQPNDLSQKCDTNLPIVVTSRAWIIGLVSGIDVSDSGLLHTTSDSIIIRDVATGSIMSDIEIEVSDISSGDISDVFIQEPGSHKTAVGDFLYFDNTDTFGGGAHGKVSWLHGECIEASAGCEIFSYLVSHRQHINLSSHGNSDRFVFTVGQYIETYGNPLNSPSIAIVSSWDYELKILTVQIITPNLIIPGDFIKDSRGNEIIIAPDYIGVVPPSETVIRRGEHYEMSNLTILDYEKPTTRLNGEALISGDLWWSVQSGKLYIFYDGYWVATQPYGTRTLGMSASDVPTGVTGIDFVATGNPPTKSQIIIADSYPTHNPDGSYLRIGDLWWSSVTGILYIWNSDLAAGGKCISCRCDSQGNVIQETAEWVSTDPSALLSWGPQGPQDQGPGAGSTPTSNESFDTNVIIATEPPTNVTTGTLWWNNSNGRLFVRYQDTWVITNPFGSESGPQSYYPDGTLDNSGSGLFELGQIVTLPESPTQKELFFSALCDFYPGDVVQFGDKEESIILKKNRHSVEIQRDELSVPLVNRIRIRNNSRAKITIETIDPHQLQIGDQVELHSTEQELNKVFDVIDVGKILPATGSAIMDGDEVSGVSLTYSGLNYTGDFYITFTGGEGGGASAIARVANGIVFRIDMISGGKNYTSAPTLKFNFECSVYFFTVYSDKWYPTPDILSYRTTSTTAENRAADITLVSGGKGYELLPTVPGIYKREIDRAVFEFTLTGTSVATVDVINGGARYVNPKAVILDNNGKGTGAQINLVVSDGIITGATLISAGIDYENPYIIVIEEGLFLPETKNIGQILAFNVIKEGRGIDPNKSKIPLVYVETNLLLEYPVIDYCSPTAAAVATWTVGDLVVTDKQANARVTNWDPTRQLLSVNNIVGNIENGDIVSEYNGSNTATVRISGQSSQDLTVSGIAKLNGNFLTDKSLLNSNLSRVQDGDYYQLFSYVIHSSVQRSKYENLVNDIVHPAGFVYFSKTKIEDSVISQNRVDVPFISTDSVNMTPIVYTEMPINPRVGNLWFNVETGTTYIYYGDRTSGQTYWIDTHQR